MVNSFYYSYMIGAKDSSPVFILFLNAAEIRPKKSDEDFTIIDIVAIRVLTNCVILVYT